MSKEGRTLVQELGLNPALVSCVSQEVSLGTSTRRYRFRVEQDLEGRKQVGHMHFLGDAHLPSHFNAALPRDLC
jgi:hypothetical protein